MDAIQIDPQQPFSDFWGRVGGAESRIRNWLNPPLDPSCKELMDDTWFELYKVSSPILQPVAKVREFQTPPNVPGDRVFSAETAHQALMFILNPPEALFGLTHVLDSREYLQVKEEAEREYLRVRPEPKPNPKRKRKVKPHWDEVRKELSYDGELCKRYRQKAERQIAVIEAFRRAGWSQRVPSPFTEEVADATGELTRDTLKSLNRNDCLLFESDGQQGILWKPVG